MGEMGMAPMGRKPPACPLRGGGLEDQLAVALRSIRGSITEYVMDDPETEGEDKSIPRGPGRGAEFGSPS